MTSRERVMKALNHEEPDRVPVMFDCSQEDKVEDLCKFYGVNDKEELMQTVGADVRFCMCWEDISPVNRFDSDETYTDMWGAERSYKGLYPVNNPMKDISSTDDIDAYGYWPSPDDIDYAAYAEKAAKHGEYAVCGGMWSCFMEVAEALLGTERFMISMLTEPELVEHMLDKIVSFYMESNRRMMDAMGPKMQIFFMADDYGTQRDLLWSPDVWRRFVKPRLKKLYDLAHERGYKVMQHSCGSIVKVIPEMIEIGLDCLQPIQVAAEGMNPVELKAQFGDKLSFMGAVDAQRVLAFGAVEEVEAEVKLRIEQLSKGGGYIMCTSQGILPECPNENVKAMFDAVG